MRRAGIAVLASVLLAGCSLGSDREPKPASRAANEVALVVDALDRATRQHDFATICRDLFTAAARRRAGGPQCARLLSSAARDVRAPSIRLLAIHIRGTRATARVRTRARGQPSLEDTLRLVKEGGEYRIEALAG